MVILTHSYCSPFLSYKFYKTCNTYCGDKAKLSFHKHLIDPRFPFTPPRGTKHAKCGTSGRWDEPKTQLGLRMVTRKLVPCNLQMPPSFKGENDIYQHVLLSMFSGRLCHSCTAISIIYFLT